jgi:[ribosomal protein S5]-alanine N-acetyltransferase
MRAPPTINTPSLRLRPFILADVEAVLAMSQEPAARKWLPSQVCEEAAEATALVQALMAAWKAEDADPRTHPLVWGIEEVASGHLIGHVGFSPFEGGVEVGFAIAEHQQGKGYATEAVTAGCMWMARNYKLPCILGITDAENLASQRVLQRCGFAMQTERKMLFQGVKRDVLVFRWHRADGG